MPQDGFGLPPPETLRAHDPGQRGACDVTSTSRVGMQTIPSYRSREPLVEDLGCHPWAGCGRVARGRLLLIPMLMPVVIW